MRIRAAILGVAMAAGFARAQQFRLPPLPAPPQFGNVLITRATHNTATKSVVFPHWRHRMLYTCRVCHFELEFSFRSNATEITEAANRNGLYCGTCHDGRTAFAVSSEANCARCHTGTVDAYADDFSSKVADLPFSGYGNGVDWSRALAEGKISPAASLAPGYEPLTLNTTLSLEAEWNFVPPAIFPHPEHIRWLDCANCHPAIFNVKKKTTQHFSMRLNLAREFCGVCHVRVAFPLHDCKRCHPTMERSPLQ